MLAMGKPAALHRAINRLVAASISGRSVRRQPGAPFESLRVADGTSRISADPGIFPRTDFEAASVGPIT